MNTRLLSAPARMILATLVVLAAAVAIAAALAGSGRVWPAYLVGAVFAITIALGGVVFVTIHHLTNAAWSTTIRRVPEALAAYLPIGAVAMLVTLAGAGALYEWTHPGVIEAEGAMAFKAAWLQLPFFAVRMVVVLGVWVGFAWLLRRQSLRQDHRPGVAATMRSRVISGVFLVVLALTITTASVDWLMSVQPHFYSTLYGWYVFSGVFASGLAAIAVVVVWLRARGLMPHVTTEHLHNLGKMVFAFSTFWAYLWFCQYMLIYYANLPEEGIYYASRFAVPGGATFFIANVALGWIVPFVLLIGRGAKRNPRWLVAGSLAVIAGHYLDIATIVLPPTTGSSVPGVIDIVVVAGFGALVLLVADRALSRAAMAPVHDPYLEEGLGVPIGELSRP